jgi:branched-chain amino acid transport system ATP-binding protein
MTVPILSVTDLQAGYGSSQVVKGLSLEVGRGEIVTLLGRNGMGKTTTLKAVMGIIRPTGGTVLFNGRAVSGLPEYKIAQAGIGLVPEGREIFPNLTVEENLTATAVTRHDRERPWTLSSVYSMFPRLRERRENMGTDLSGGEQQMLAIGRALMLNPFLLILDEATEGLSPLVRADIWRCLAELQSLGMSLIVVDKNIGPLLRLGNRHYVVEKGQVVWSGSSDELRLQRQRLAQYLGV